MEQTTLFPVYLDSRLPDLNQMSKNCIKNETIFFIIAQHIGYSEEPSLLAVKDCI